MNNIFFQAPPRDDLCEKFPSVLLLDGIFREILIDYFSSSELITLDSLKHRVFDHDPKRTKLRIEPVYRWTYELIENVPAIIIRRGKLEQKTPGISFASVERPDIEGYEMLKIWIGQHSFVCISKIPAEAEELGFELVKMFSDCKVQIARKCKFSSFDVAGLEPLTIIQDTSERLFGSTVAVGYTLSDTVEISPPK